MQSAAASILLKRYVSSEDFYGSDIENLQFFAAGDANSFTRIISIRREGPTHKTAWTLSQPHEWLEDEALSSWFALHQNSDPRESATWWNFSAQYYSLVNKGHDSADANMEGRRLAKWFKVSCHNSSGLSIKL